MLADHSRLIVEFIIVNTRFNTEFGFAVRAVVTSCVRRQGATAVGLSQMLV